MLRHSKLLKDRGVSDLTQPDLYKLLSALPCPALFCQCSKPICFQFSCEVLGENGLTLTALECFLIYLFLHCKNIYLPSAFWCAAPSPRLLNNTHNACRIAFINCQCCPGDACIVTFVCPGLGLWAWLWPTVAAPQPAGASQVCHGI